MQAGTKRESRKKGVMSYSLTDKDRLGMTAALRAGVLMHTSNKNLREWEELVRSTGCCVTGANNDVEIHHVKGRKYKHNKVHIGGVYILPLHKSVHMVTGDHPKAWHKGKWSFIKEFGFPYDLYKNVLEELGFEKWERYVNQDQYAAIMGCPI